MITVIVLNTGNSGHTVFVHGCTEHPAIPAMAFLRALKLELSNGKLKQV